MSDLRRLPLTELTARPDTPGRRRSLLRQPADRPRARAPAPRAPSLFPAPAAGGAGSEGLCFATSLWADRLRALPARRLPITGI